MKIRVAFLCCVTWLQAGCETKPPLSPPAVNGSGSNLGENERQVSEAEAHDVAEKIIDAITRNDFAAINTLFDWQAMIERTMDGAAVPSHVAAGVRQGMRKQLETENALIKKISSDISDGGTYQLLHVHEVDGRPRAMLRLLHPERGLNYHDYVLAKGADGSCRAIDVHIFLSGELLSTTMRRMLLVIADMSDQSLFSRLTGKSQLLAKHQKIVLSLSQKSQAGDFSEVMRLYKSLPEDLQTEKSLLLIAVVAASGAGDDASYQKLLASFREHHPDDACIDFLSVDYFLARKEYPKAVTAIESVCEAVGGDPYLDVMMGNAMVMAEDFDEAKACFEFARDTDASLLDAWWGLVAVSLKKDDFPATLALLKAIDQAFAMNWVDLTEQEDYSRFVESPQHEEWLAYLAAKPPN